MKISQKTKDDAGGCNFCNQDTYQQVTVINGEGHGPQLEARFCHKCLSDIVAFHHKKYTNNPKNQKIMNNTQELTRWLRDHYNETDLLKKVDEKMSDYVDEDEIEEHGSVYDAYLEVGRGGAHADVVNKVYHNADAHYVGEDLPWDVFEEAFVEAFDEGENLIAGME